MKRHQNTSIHIEIVKETSIKAIQVVIQSYQVVYHRLVLTINLKNMIKDQTQKKVKRKGKNKI